MPTAVCFSVVFLFAEPFSIPTGSCVDPVSAQCGGLRAMCGGPLALGSLLKVPVDVIIIIIEYLCDCWWTVLAPAWQWER